MNTCYQNARFGSVHARHLWQHPDIRISPRFDSIRFDLLYFDMIEFTGHDIHSTGQGGDGRGGWLGRDQANSLKRRLYNNWPRWRKKQSNSPIMSILDDRFLFIWFSFQVNLIHIQRCYLSHVSVGFPYGKYSTKNRKPVPSYRSLDKVSINAAPFKTKLVPGLHLYNIAASAFPRCHTMTINQFGRLFFF